MKFDVVIIGAGPAGLSFARSLADTNLNIAIIEKQTRQALINPLYDGRDIALTHHSVKLLNELDAWQHIPAIDISPIKEARVLDGVSPYYLHFDHRKVCNDALGYLVSNHLIRKSLYEEVSLLSNVTLFAETVVNGVSVDNVSASVFLSNGESLDASLLVAADSRFSETRRMAGLSADMLDFGQTVIVCRMSHEKPHLNIAHECFHYGRTLAVLPLNGNKSSIVITAPTDLAKDIIDMSEEVFNKDITYQFNNKLGKMKLISERHAYPLVAVHAKKFYSNRFALIGDAAVGMHPVTAHGFNLGVRGQNILAREIKSAIKNRADIGAASVLEKYHAKHRKLTRPLYLGTNSIVKLFNDNKLPARIARKSILRLSNHIWPIKRAIMNQLTAIEN